MADGLRGELREKQQKLDQAQGKLEETQKMAESLKNEWDWRVADFETRQREWEREGGTLPLRAVSDTQGMWAPTYRPFHHINRGCVCMCACDGALSFTYVHLPILPPQCGCARHMVGHIEHGKGSLDTGPGARRADKICDVECTARRNRSSRKKPPTSSSCGNASAV